MSRDIYMFVEKRDHDATWQLAGEPELFVETVINLETGNRWYRPHSLDLYVNREVMDVLVGQGDPPGAPGSLAQARGLPPDVSPILRAEADYTMDFAHTHSWLSLADLLDFDWYGKTERVYGQARSEYAALFVEGQPFPPGVPRGASGWHTVGEPPSSPRSLEPGYAPVSWVRIYADAGEFLHALLPELHRHGTPENVRIVFWFG